MDHKATYLKALANMRDANHALTGTDEDFGEAYEAADPSNKVGFDGRLNTIIGAPWIVYLSDQPWYKALLEVRSQTLTNNELTSEANQGTSTSGAHAATDCQ
jgi:hypothetical protein